MPAAPRWFEEAIAVTPERQQVRVSGIDIEWLGWGARGRPGLLLLHGGAGHADWWRFIAPFLAETHRVVAPSWGGMGNSGHRRHYPLDGFVDEMLAVAEASGLAASGPFAAAGHSFGGFPLMALANRPDTPLCHAIILDTPFITNWSRDDRSQARPHRVYPSLTEALAHFRWLPGQPTSNLFIADFIARHSLRTVPGGYTWKFDPFLWQHFEADRSMDPLPGARCPVTLLWGAESRLMPKPMVDDMLTRLPPGTRKLAIPEAHHHLPVDQPLALVTALRALLS